MIYAFDILKDEYWWGGGACFGDKAPFTAQSEIEMRLTGADNMDCANQSMPFFLSSCGRYIWSNEAFNINFSQGKIYIEAQKEVKMHRAGTTLRDAYLDASKRYFPFDGAELPCDCFETPQYNTWMHCTYYPTQATVLEYAHSIIENGFDPGVLIIDEGWHKPYGTWEFDPVKFPDPKAMIDELHNMGFKLLLWVCPFVTCSGVNYVKSLRMPAESGVGTHGNRDLYLRLENGEVALVGWWNGVCAILDFTQPADREFLKTQLDRLISDLGVDGFKFDGGHLFHYSDYSCKNGHINKKLTHYDRNIAWNEFGRQYFHNEFKDTFKGGGRCSVQRLRDRNHSWDHEGINTIIPYCLSAGLIGSPFICPDMIGGGEWTFIEYCKKGEATFDTELFIRMCQVSALFPMMQFSMLPWEYLNSDETDICRNMAKLHREFSPYILKAINESRISGEPIIRHLAYEFPDGGYEKTTDCFMLGEKYLVAPVIKKGEREKEVKLPAGFSWKYVNGTIYKGGQTVTVPAPINVLPYFERI